MSVKSISDGLSSLQGTAIHAAEPKLRPGYWYRGKRVGEGVVRRVTCCRETALALSRKGLVTRPCRHGVDYYSCTLTLLGLRVRIELIAADLP